MSDAKFAKILLQGHNCNDCYYNENRNCLLVEPVKVKYPKDVQVFFDGMLKNEGPPNVAYVLVGNEVRINQKPNNGGTVQLNYINELNIFSRGLDKNGGYECQKIKVDTQLNTIPQDNVCEYWLEKDKT